MATNQSNSNDNGKPTAPDEHRALLARSFSKFLDYHLRLEGYSIGNIQLDMADALQLPDREKILIGFRGISKTTVVKNYVAWRWLRNPRLKVKIVSDCLDHARPMAKDVLNFLRLSPIMNVYAPKTTRLSRTYFDLDYVPSEKDPSLSCIGIDGSITSTRADLIVADDIINLDNCATAALREQMLWKIGEFNAILHPAGRHLRNNNGTLMSKDEALARLPMLPELCQIVTIGTYQDDRSILLPTDNEDHPLLKAKRYTFPAMKQDPEGEEFNNKFAGKWKATFPQRLTLQELRERCHDPNKFALDYLCDVQMIKKEEQVIKIENIPLKELESKFTYCFVDPAQGGSDETVAVFGGPVGSSLYVQMLKAWRCDTPTWAREVVSMARAAKVVELHVESQAPAIVSIVQGEIIKQGGGLILRAHTQGKNKQQRLIDTLEPALNSGKVVFHPAVLQNDSTKSQLASLRRSEKLEPNDRADAITMLINGFSSFLAHVPTRPNSVRIG